MQRATSLLALTVGALALGSAKSAASGPTAPVAPAVLPSAAPPPLDLGILLVHASRHHPRVLQARARESLARSEWSQSTLWSNPILDASYTQAVRSSAYDRAGTMSFGVTQPLELSGIPLARGRASAALLEATRLDGISALRAVRFEIEVAYYGYVAAHNREAIAREHASNVREILLRVRSRVEAGLGPRYDLTRVELALGDADSQVAAQQTELVKARSALTLALGVALLPPHSAPTADLGAPAPVPVAQTRAPHPSVVAAEKRVDASWAEVDVARRAVWSGFGLRIGTAYGQGPGQWDLGLSLTIPLPLVDRGQASVRAAESRWSIALLEAKMTADLVSEQNNAARVEWEQRHKTHASFHATTVPLLRRLSVEARSAYQDGRISSFELLESMAARRDAAYRAVDLGLAARTARSALIRLVGADP